MELERELEKTRESHQSTVEELESANEELKSTNEELQSANEELQSTNEENESSKEELRALNEELQTANDQLEQKIAELRATNDDIRNLLNSTEVASVFVDEQLRVRRFTPEATQIINLIDSDVGRPLEDIVTKLEYSNLLDDVKRASEALETQQKDLRSSEGPWYRMRVVPYRTSDNRIDGAVITFVNIDEQKQTELRLEDALTEARETWEAVRALVELVGEPVAILDREQAVLVGNDAFARAVGRSGGGLEGLSFQELLVEDGSSELSDKLRESAEGSEPCSVGPVRFDGEGEYTLSGTPLRAWESAPGSLLIRLRSNGNG